MIIHNALRSIFSAQYLLLSLSVFLLVTLCPHDALSEFGPPADLPPTSRPSATPQPQPKPQPEPQPQPEPEPEPEPEPKPVLLDCVVDSLLGEPPLGGNSNDSVFEIRPGIFVFTASHEDWREGSLTCFYVGFGLDF